MVGVSGAGVVSCAATRPANTTATAAATTMSQERGLPIDVAFPRSRNLRGGAEPLLIRCTCSRSRTIIARKRQPDHARSPLDGVCMSPLPPRFARGFVPVPVSEFDRRKFLSGLAIAGTACAAPQNASAADAAAPQPVAPPSTPE